MNTVNFNGELMDRSEAKVAMSARGVQIGVGAFETMLAVNGVVDGIELHMLRLKSGMERLGYGLTMENPLTDLIKEVITENDLLETKARVRVTTMDGFYMVEAEEAPARSEACSVVVSEFVRNERSATAGIKCSSYAENALALKAGQAEGADEVILLNTLGEVAESATANVFLVKGETLITPRLESGCLPGVTRELILRRTEKAGMKTSEDVVLLEDLMDADEVFLTNTLVGVRAVEKIGGAEVTDGVGVITQKVKDIYLGLNKSEEE